MRFAYVASHDLQEPLRLMVNYLQLLDAAMDDPASKAGKHYLDVAVKQGFRMKNLIQALLEYTAVESTKEKITAVNAQESLELALSNLQAAITETRAQIQADKLPLVMSEKTLLAQVFQNLIGNALKYRSEQPPLIRIGVRRDVDIWTFSVSDNGLGINPIYHRKIFDMFQRLHGRTHHSGTGIGLSICKKIIELHGGQIWVESKEGEGSSFYFTLAAVTVDDILSNQEKSA
jgi:light-regulated signal transduction histidine kinase (bacteriophytochrome)